MLQRTTFPWFHRFYKSPHEPECVMDNHLRTTYCYVPGGFYPRHRNKTDYNASCTRIRGWEPMEFLLECFYDFLSTPTTWFVVNFGVHYGGLEQQHLYKETDVPNFATWYKRRQFKPRMLWRETLPQHYKETVDGLYSIWGQHSTCGDILTKMNGTSRQFYNDIANPRLQAVGIPILTAWTELAGTGNRFHKGLLLKTPWQKQHSVSDCTHYSTRNARDGSDGVNIGGGFSAMFLVNAKTLLALDTVL